MRRPTPLARGKEGGWGPRQKIHLNVRIFGRSPRMPARKDGVNVRERGARPLPQVTGDFPSAADPA